MFEDRSVTADQDVLEVVRRVLADPRHIRVQSGLIGFVANSSCKFHESLTICPMSREESVAARIAHPDRIQDLTEGAPVDDGLANLDHKRLDGFHLLTGSGREQSPPHSARSIVGEHIRPPLGSPNRSSAPGYAMPIVFGGAAFGGIIGLRRRNRRTKMKLSGHRAARTSSVWPSTLTLRQIFAIDPASSIRNVDRSIPKYSRPYMFFRFHTSYAVVTCPSSSLSSGKFRWYLSLNFTWLFVSSRLTPRTTAP